MIDFLDYFEDWDEPNSKIDDTDEYPDKYAHSTQLIRYRYFNDDN